MVASLRRRWCLLPVLLVLVLVLVLVVAVVVAVDAVVARGMS